MFVYIFLYIHKVGEAIAALDGSNIEDQGKPYTLHLYKYDGPMS